MPKKKYYLVLDTETATLSFSDTICRDSDEKQKISIAKPLVYDIGWLVIDRQGNVIHKENYLVQETFFVPSVFNTAYYSAKRELYLQMYEAGQIKSACWNDIVEVLLRDLRNVDIAVAYNAAFDFKKAIPFTESYIEALYSAEFNNWERKQRYSCNQILNGKNKEGMRPDYLEPYFELRGEVFDIADLWTIACDRLINIDRYRDYCLSNGLITPSAQYFKSSAETSYKYLLNNREFVESHTALNDAEIEAEILLKALRKGAVKPSIEAFPFRKLGTTFDYVQEKKPKYAGIVADALQMYLQDKGTTRYTDRMYKVLETLLELV